MRRSREFPGRGGDQTPAREGAAELARAATEIGIWTAVAAFAREHLGASHVFVLRRDAAAAVAETAFSQVFSSGGSTPVHAFRSAAALSGMGLVAAPPAPGTGGTFASLFEAVPGAAAGLAYAEIDSSHVLVLVYRGACPVLSRRSWLLLDDLRHRAATALAAVPGRQPPAAAGPDETFHDP